MKSVIYRGDNSYIAGELYYQMLHAKETNTPVAFNNQTTLLIEQDSIYITDVVTETIYPVDPFGNCPIHSVEITFSLTNPLEKEKKMLYKGKKIYIAGKITGNPEFKEQFKNLENWYKERGGVVLNPAELPANMGPGDYMRICLAMVDSSDIVHFLPNHKDSKGAHIEFCYAEYIGKHIVETLTEIEVIQQLEKERHYE